MKSKNGAGKSSVFYGYFLLLISNNFNRSEHNGKDPTIVIDLKELNKALSNMDRDGLVLGGRFERINEILDYFFGELKKCNAKLVFIARLHDGRFEDIDEYQPCDKTYVAIEKHGSMMKHPIKFPNGCPLRPNERTWHNLLHICSKYGEVTGCYNLCMRSILAYTRKNCDKVLAVITRDTEYFAYNVDFDYWSISDIELNTLKIAKFCRQTLNRVLGLNIHQMQLMLAISEVKPFEHRPFLDKVECMKKHKCGPNGFHLHGHFTEEQRKEIKKETDEMKKYDKYAGQWNVDIYSELLMDLITNDPDFDAILKFFKEKIHFAYKLVNETMTSHKDLLYIDEKIRRSNSRQFIDLVVQTTLKLIGTAFKDVEPEKRPITRSMQIKRDFSRAAAEQSEMNVVYPTRKCE